MLKLIFYLGLTSIGVVGTFINPLIGAVACIEAYLMNPNTLAMSGGEIRYQLITTVAFLASYFIRRPRPLPAVGKEGRPLMWLWAFVALALASCFWAVISTTQGLGAWYELFKTVLILPFILRVIRTERDMKIIVMACLVGIWHAAFLHTVGVKLGYTPLSHDREFGVLEQGQTAVLIIFIPLFFILAVKGSKWERIVSICAIPFILDSLVATYQRVGFVVLLAEVLILLFLLPRKITFTLLPVLALAGALFAFRLTPQNYWNWMSTVEDPNQESSAHSRFVINACSRQMLMDYPFGVGYRNYLDVSHRYLDAKWLDDGRRSAHNTYYEVACEIGIPGFVLFMMAFGGTALRLRQIRKQADRNHPGRLEIYAMGFEIGLYGWFLGGCFHDMHNINPAYWIVAFAIALARIQGNRDRETFSPKEIAALEEAV